MLKPFPITRAEKVRVAVTFLVLVVAIMAWARGDWSTGNPYPWWLRLAVLAMFLVLTRFFLLGEEGERKGETIGPVWVILGFPCLLPLGLIVLMLYLAPGAGF